MTNFKFNTLFPIFLLFSLTFSQETFKVIKLEGTVKVQSADNKAWKTLSSGDEVSDNDIIETFFKSNVTLQYSRENLVILGPNSKMLLNLRKPEEGSGKNSKASFTLFNGGTLVKTVENDPATIFTSNGVAQVDSGTVTTVVESKTGHTGFQTLGGKASIRNISEQKNMNLALGMTSIILAGKSPTAPLYITYRHVAVLKHFFGETYIDRQIERAGIKPTEESTGSSQLSLSDNLQNKNEADGYMHKRLFSQDRIWGLILENEKGGEKSKLATEFTPIGRPYKIMNNKMEIHFRSTVGILGGITFPKFQLIPTFYLKKTSIGLNLPLAKNSTQKMSFNAKSIEGVLEKINHLTFGLRENHKYFHIGPIENYTLGRGLIVNNFKNKNDYAVTQPLGIELQAKNDKANFQAFIASITHWRVGGIHSEFYPGNSWLSLSYTYDANQYSNTLDENNSRFIPSSSFTGFNITTPTKEERKSNAHIIDVGLGHRLAFSNEMKFGMFFQYANKLGAINVNSGYIVKGPEFELTYKQFKFGLGYIQENGKLLDGYMGNMYMSNRFRFIDNSGDSLKITTFDHLNEVNNLDNEINNSKTSYGLFFSISASIVNGFNASLSGKTDFLNRTSYKDSTDEGLDTILNNNPVNFSYKLSLQIDEKLTKYIKYGEIYLLQENGSYYPNGASIFASWSFEAGLNLQTAPLIFNLALDLGYKFSYIDISNQSGSWGILNNSIDANDALSEFYIGIRWGYTRQARKLL